MANQRKAKSIRGYFSLTIILFLVGLILFVSGIMALGYFYFQSRATGLLAALIAVTSVFVVAFLLSLFLISRRIRRIYVDALLRTTSHNYRRINESSSTLLDYPHSTIKEFAELNDEVEALRVSLANATLLFDHLDYSKFELIEVPGLENTYELASFQKHLESVIGASMSFRNAIAEVYYPMDNPLSMEEVKTIVSSLKSLFAKYKDIAFLLPADRKSVYLYLPRLDGFTAVEEKLQFALQGLSLARHTVEGIVSAPPHYTIVAYPFSAVRDLFADLRYAKRQGKQTNLYLPNRPLSPQEGDVSKNAMHLNQMSKVLLNVASIETDRFNKQTVRKEIASVLSSINAEAHFEVGGIVAYDQEVGGYVVKDLVGEVDFLKLGDTIDRGLVEQLSHSVEADHSLYFACRAHLPSEICRYADKKNYESGFFYLLVKEKTPIGFIFFINSDGEAHLDSYMQEALSAACYHISTSFVMGEVLEDSVEARRQFEASLTIAGASTYQIEKDTHNILSFSRGLPALFPKAEVGKPCYSCLYGLNKPCPDCPLSRGKKKLTSLGSGTYATSLTFDVKMGRIHTLHLQKVENDEQSLDRYDKELLAVSFPTLVDEVANHFMIGDNGYVLLLRVDNHAKLLSEFGPEGLLLIYRSFIESIKGLSNGQEYVYRYDPQTLALLLPVSGQVDIIDRCEEIHRLSKHLVYEGNVHYDLDITYMSMNYPQGYASASDFFRHVYRDATRRKFAQGSDFIYFDDTDYVRPASRRDFILSVLEEQFGKDRFGVSLQPVVYGGRIQEAEALLRIQDEIRHIVFSPDELVRVAAENGKLGLISSALLRYVASFYQSIGPATLKALGLKRIGLNINVSLFADEAFEQDLDALAKDKVFDNSFLAFEVPEYEIGRAQDAFVAAVKKLRRFDIALAIDQYTGKHFSLDSALAIGVTHIKVSRGLVNHIDSDQKQWASLKALLLEAMSKGIDVTVVGVENRDQAEMILSANPNVSLQGYYYYRPLEREALIDALRNQK